MKALAMNGSARRTWNTASLLEQALCGARDAGAETKLVHLFDLDYRGCRGCHACKRLGSPGFGRCVQNDGLRPLLEEAIAADVLLLGSPIYFGEVTAAMRGFLERLWFPAITYSREPEQVYPKRVRVGFVFAQNAPEGTYTDLFDRYVATSGALIGPSEYVASCETLQFDDYSQYASSMFDVPARLARRRDVFPQELQAAYAMGRRLVEEA